MKTVNSVVKIKGTNLTGKIEHITDAGWYFIKNEKKFNNLKSLNSCLNKPENEFITFRAEGLESIK